MFAEISVKESGVLSSRVDSSVITTLLRYHGDLSSPYWRIDVVMCVYNKAM